MHALMLTSLLLGLALGYYSLLHWPSRATMGRPRTVPTEPNWLIRARQLFWLALYNRLSGRVRRIWRFCRRHYGWGIEILQNAQFLAQQLL